MGDVKMHSQRLRLDVRYPGKPGCGQPEPLPGAPVHLYTANLFKACRKPKSGLEMGTHDANKVTCPTCLKLVNHPAHPKQPPCGSPASVSADAGFLFGSE